MNDDELRTKFDEWLDWESTKEMTKNALGLGQLRPLVESAYSYGAYTAMGSDVFRGRLVALQSRPPADGGDKWKGSDTIRGWPSGHWYVYEARTINNVYSHRMVIPQACSDAQVELVVKQWLDDIGTKQ